MKGAITAVAQRPPAKAPARVPHVSTSGGRLDNTKSSSIMASRATTGTHDSTRRRIDNTDATAVAIAELASPKLAEFIVLGAVSAVVALPATALMSMHEQNAAGPSPVRAVMTAETLTRAMVLIKCVAPAGMITAENRRHHWPLLKLSLIHI